MIALQELIWIKTHLRVFSVLEGALSVPRMGFAQKIAHQTNVMNVWLCLPIVLNVPKGKSLNMRVSVCFVDLNVRNLANFIQTIP